MWFLWSKYSNLIHSILFQIFFCFRYDIEQGQYWSLYCGQSGHCCAWSCSLVLWRGGGSWRIFLGSGGGSVLFYCNRLSIFGWIIIKSNLRVTWNVNIFLLVPSLIQNQPDGLFCLSEVVWIYRGSSIMLSLNTQRRKLWWWCYHTTCSEDNIVNTRTNFEDWLKCNRIKLVWSNK